MILLISNNKIAAVATDEYSGEMESIQAPEDFKPEYMNYYVVIDGDLVLPWETVNKDTAEGCLQDTDWTATVDISDPQHSDPYLANQNAFLTYRSQVRSIAVNPPAFEIANWPVMPQEEWLPGSPEAYYEVVPVVTE